MEILKSNSDAKGIFIRGIDLENLMVRGLSLFGPT
jgi:hypothetical protein